MKKIYLFLILINVTVAYCFAKADKKPDLSSMIYVEIEDEKNCIKEKSNFFLYSEKFNLIFEGITEKQNICLFAGADSRYESKYNFPVKADETEIFCGGCGLAEKKFIEGEDYSLSVTDSYSFHYITNDRRRNTEKGAVLPVSAISDSTGSFKGDLYISVYVDFNNNNKIESNEYAFFSLHFPLFGSSTELDFSDKNRGYFCTMGFSFLQSKMKYIGEEFKVYKICSERDFQKLCEIENKNFIGTNLESRFIYYFENINYDENSYYICFIPQGYNQIGNCFRLKGSNAVYLECKKILPEEERPVNLRSFNIKKTSIDPEIGFYCDGKLIKVNIILF